MTTTNRKRGPARPHHLSNPKSGGTESSPERNDASPSPSIDEAAALPQPLEHRDPDEERLSDQYGSDFPVVAVGGSAGSLEAVSLLLESLPPQPGFAIVVLQHLDPRHKSVMADLFSCRTAMAVCEVQHTTKIEKDQVYVLSPNNLMTMSEGALHPVVGGGLTPPAPIDHFMKSLAEDQRERAIGVILSGNGSDGTYGLAAIKAAGGITFAQDDTAKNPAMPRSAIESGAADMVLQPRAIADELLRLVRTEYVRKASQQPAVAGGPDDSAAFYLKIFEMLRRAHDVDFRHYKPTTVRRRIQRRIMLRKLNSLSDYLRYLREHPHELHDLYQDLLIRVTGFFRDPEVFDYLREELFPRIISQHSDGSPIRIWVPGCATGEEAFSLAIIATEAIVKCGAALPLQIFGTDVSDYSIERARSGIYPENIAAEVSTERLSRFFVKVDGSYRISKSIRESCIFARQNLTKDPPFSRLDLISCRNVLIYLGPVLQEKVMNIFHYSLRPTGYLLLGNSESVGRFSHFFSPVDRRYRVFSRTITDSTEPEFIMPGPRKTTDSDSASAEELSTPGPLNVFREADRVLLSRFAPAGVVVDNNLTVVQFRGRTGRYLEQPQGAATFDLLKIIRHGLFADLRGAIATVRRTGAPHREEGIRIELDGEPVTVDIEVIPFSAFQGQRMFIVLFDESAGAEGVAQRRRTGAKVPTVSQAEDGHLARLKKELDSTRSYLQSIIEEQEATNEELRSANEEIQSTNEELQSTNEEMETAKEELQSTNEELTTLNEELTTRNDELDVANNDLANTLNSIDIPILIVDAHFRLRRFNPVASELFGIVPGDLGRTLGEIRTPIVEDLQNEVQKVVERLQMHEQKVRDANGRSYWMRVRPYRTLENKIDGAVIVIVDVERLTEEWKKSTSDVHN